MRIAMGLLVLACVVASAGTAHAEKRAPGVYVSLTCPAVSDDGERATHIQTIKNRLAASSLLANKQVDVNVTRLAWVTNGNSVEIHVELAFMMSSNNEITSVANQTAKLVMSKGQFSVGKLPMLRKEVIDTALGDLLYKLRRAQTRSV
jgi:hypothetical protein